MFLCTVFGVIRLVNSLTAAFCLIFFLIFPAKGSDIENIKSLVSSGNYAYAINELEKLKQENQDAFEANNYDYLLARLAEKEGDFALAIANYQSVINRNSILKEYAAWHSSQIFSRNPLLERIFLYEILLESPKSLLQTASRKRLARSFYENQEFDEAERFLLLGLSQKGESIDREDLVLFGLTLLQNQKNEKARTVFNKVLETSNLQSDDLNLVAVQKLDEIESTNEKLSSQEHFERGKIYYLNREFDKARSHFLTILKDFPESANTAECLYLIGKSYYSEENYNEAIKWFERVIADFPDSSKNALSQAASAYSRVNKPKEALARYKKFIEKYGDDENLDRIYFNIIDILRDTGQESDALLWADKTIEKFKGKPAEVAALFVKARIRMARKDWVNALKDFEEIENRLTEIASVNVSEIKFLKGYCLEQLKEYEKAIEEYVSIVDGLYYGWRATERLKQLAEMEDSKPLILKKFNHYFSQAEQKLTLSNADQVRQATQKALRLTNEPEKTKRLLEILKQSYSLLPKYRGVKFGKPLELEKMLSLASYSTHKQLASALLSLEIYDEGTAELELALRKKQSVKTSSDNLTISSLPLDATYTLAEYYTKAEICYRALAYLESLWKNVPIDYRIEAISKDYLKLLYPTPYKRLLLASKEKSKLDPRFVLAIMRQESRFQPYAKSTEAARGLMQFIPSTAKRFAIELQLKDFSTEDLYNPKIAILLGNAYLSKLFLLFPNQPQAVAAAYNGGEKNMLRWFLRAKSDDPDLYVSEILFTQSKDYVQKVMMNYRIYKMIYDENLDLVNN
jgi:soluble lytic murein transglycosylase